MSVCDKNDHPYSRIMGQVVAGVCNVHNIGLTHGDVKPSNFLVDKKLSVVKITDFSFSGGK